MMSKHDDQAAPGKDQEPMRSANDGSAGDYEGRPSGTGRKERVQVGDLAPDFTLSDQSGTPVHLGGFVGKTCIVLYFYPRDNTSICTAEACAFRDNYEVFKDVGADVIGVSSDSVESHQQFAADYQLPFTLLSDTDSEIRKRYGVPTAFGLPGRVTYVIDRQGIVRHIFFSQFASEKHVTQALQAVQSIREEDTLN
jgi:thioredoxin-dependent peroxiredoxin